MFSWSQKRQFLYFLIPFSIFIIVISFIYFSFFYRPASCFDGVKNGKETGIDCGGSCSLVCTGDSLNPITLWSKAFLVTNDVYNLVAFVQNPNPSSEAKNVHYVFSAYDDEGLFIGKREGKTTISKNKKFVVFESGFKSIKNIKRLDFDFVYPIVWQKNLNKEPNILIENDPIENQKNSPKIQGFITNKSDDLEQVELTVLIYDGKGNAINTSKTFLEKLPKGIKTPFVFTWPKPFSLGEDVCEIPTATVLAIDRSGSMASISKDPPEPLNSVKNVAIDFINRLTTSDMVSVVSFANNASSPVDQPLTFYMSSAKEAVLNISIGTTSVQNTNIADGLFTSFSSLYEKSNLDGFKKIIILLTDGKPTVPSDKNNPNYAYDYSLSLADDIKSAGVVIYTIGLGDQIDDIFLKKIATDENKYFFAPNTKSLDGIYKEISASICKRKPNLIEIIANIK